MFAPLSSSFLHKSKRISRVQIQRATGDIPGESNPGGEETAVIAGKGQAQAGRRQSQGEEISAPTTRAQWIMKWAKENPSRPTPCSAKAAYRLADSKTF